MSPNKFFYNKYLCENFPHNIKIISQIGPFTYFNTSQCKSLICTIISWQVADFNTHKKAQLIWTVSIRLKPNIKVCVKNRKTKMHRLELAEQIKFIFFHLSVNCTIIFPLCMKLYIGVHIFKFFLRTSKKSFVTTYIFFWPCD